MDDEYSEKYIAENKPTGPEIITAINDIRKVPLNTGITPKAPVDTPWSALIAICG